MKLWDKGYSIDNKIEQFTIGNDRIVDVHIAKYDVLASKAHAKMLTKIGILSSKELESLVIGLDEILVTIENGTFTIDSYFEDVHSKIEWELTQKCGEAGKKIHTGRSRNDQVLVALQLYYKEQLKGIKIQIKTLFDSLLQLAETHQQKFLPGYTHLQIAMPSSFGLWFAAYAELLIDDIHILNATLKVVDQNPLGSAAGYGSSFALDRDFTTKEMEFATLKFNVVAAQMARGKSERTVANTLSSIANTLSRFAMDICLYMSQNFDFISFPDTLTTGSSIMPHKKNPDVFELVRGNCNKMQSLPTEMLLITNNLPSGYHRDYQLLKENMINGIENLKAILDIFDYSINQIIVKDINPKEEKYKYLFTVDSINHLVQNGMSFREAYQQIGKEIQEETYTPNMAIQHTHLGSIHNLALKEIKDKFPS